MLMMRIESITYLLAQRYQFREWYVPVLVQQSNSSKLTTVASGLPIINSWPDRFVILGMCFFLKSNQNKIGHLYNIQFTIALIGISWHMIMIILHSIHNWIRLLMSFSPAAYIARSSIVKASREKAS